MKGILLAGGSGARLRPMTNVVNKHLLPIYDKPMIYYSLSILMKLGIKDILIISNSETLNKIKILFGDGVELGLSLSYEIQEKALGIAEAFLIGEAFIANESVCLVLGDNLIYGDLSQLKDEFKGEGALVFAYQIANPSEFGVVEIDQHGRIVSIEEKPNNPKSNYVIPGVYFYDNNVSMYAKTLQATNRGEIEIGQINNIYLKNELLHVKKLEGNVFWFDAGTPKGLFDASIFVEEMQRKDKVYIDCIEEIAWKNGFITERQFFSIANKYSGTDYGQYLLNLLNNKH